MATTRSPDNHKREKAGRFGTDITAYSATIGTLTANTTTLQAVGTPFPPTSVDAYFLERVSVNVLTAASDADGTVLMKLQKVRGGSAGTIIDLTTTFSLESDGVTTTQTSFDVPILSTLTPAQFAFLQGDALYLSTANNSAAIDTQPVGVVTVEFAAGA